MPLSDIANVSIVVSARGPSLAGFGEPLICAMAPWQVPVVVEYSSLTDLVNAGCPVTSPVYLEATALLAQTPSPPFFKVGKRTVANEYTQVLNMTCVSVLATDVYSFSLRTPGGTFVPFSVPSTGVPATDAVTITTAITTNVALATSPLHGSGLVATTSTVKVVLTMGAGTLIDVQFDSHNMQFADVSTLAGTGLTGDLAAILAFDSNWFALLLDSNSPAELAQAFAFCESNKMLGCFNCSDYQITQSASTTDIAYTTHNSAYVSSYGLYSGTTLLSYSGAALAGLMLPTQPGSENWAFKTLAGIPADSNSALPTAGIHAVETKGWNVYTALAGVNLTQFGAVPGGTFIDVTRSIYWLQNLIQINILTLLSNNNKVPFTPAGRDMVMAVVQAALTQGIAVGMLTNNPAPVVTAPLIANVNPTNKSARNFPGVSFTAKLAGAINSITLTGTVTS